MKNQSLISLVLIGVIFTALYSNIQTLNVVAYILLAFYLVLSVLGAFKFFTISLVKDLSNEEYHKKRHKTLMTFGKFFANTSKPIEVVSITWNLIIGILLFKAGTYGLPLFVMWSCTIIMSLTFKYTSMSYYKKFNKDLNG